MANYYQDFIGLNTFIYEPVGWDIVEDLSETLTSGVSINKEQNIIGIPVTLESNAVLSNYKNFNFSHHLPTTASFFPALMLHRNGPYGFPTWKQVRVGQNTLTRRQIKENVLTVVREPGPEFIFTRSGATRRQRAKYGDILPFTETPVVSKFKPVLIQGSTNTSEGMKRISITTPLANAIVQFNNPDLNKELGLVDLTASDYEELKKLYLKGALVGDKSPLDIFEAAIYRETVYPPQVYTYKNYVRQRTTFTFPWRDVRENRTPDSLVDNGFGSNITASQWNMDAYSKFETAIVRPSALNSTIVQFTGFDRNIANDLGDCDNGILQNQYCYAVVNLLDSGSFADLDEILRPAPLYNRKHFLTPLTSSINMNGMIIEGINNGTLFNPIDKNQLPAGEAKWEAGSQSGKNPFYDSYENYIDGARQIGKDMSIIPEFRISNHVSFYETKSPLEENLDVFEITGGLSNTTGSNQDNFYKIYSNSDFMKSFEMFVDDNESMGSPIKIGLKCSGIKKLLPYDGFYPQQRTVQIAQQFFSSYSASVAMSGSSEAFAANPALIGFQNVLTPLFAPGILFNSIKSGVAVDYPTIRKNLSEDGTTNGLVLKETDDYYCSHSGNVGATWYYTIHDGLIFDRRIPFEVLLKPEALGGMDLYCNEPSIFANHSSSATINGISGDRLYSLMMHNFLSETSNFFLERKNYTTFYSKPSNQLEHFEKDKDYMMRVKMYKTTDDAQISNVSGGVGQKYFVAPQYASSSNENFTMYSRPSAFGPPSKMSSSVTLAGTKAYNYSASNDVYVLEDDHLLGNRSDLGENYPFTPPYYHGQSWADIKFTPTADGPYSVKQIINSASVTYYRYVHPDTDTGENIFDIPSGSAKTGPAYIQNNFYNKNALQLSASVNLFSIERDQQGALEEETARWVIQTKWESPMLNFNHLSSKTSVTLPLNASQSVPRGMWHQYGLIEEDQNKGIFMQIEDMKETWVTNILGKENQNVLSLAEKLNFSTKPKRLGEVADAKVISEAIVAVPFVEEDGLRKYFHVPRQDVDNVLIGNIRTGATVEAMVNKMQKYVFPPNMDFLNNRSLDPFAMYIFEFSHTLTQRDLADIWQGLYPKVTEKFETCKSEIAHPLLAQEILGGGSKLVQQAGGFMVDTGAEGTPLPSKIRWMVFKVKQRATTNYWRKMADSSGDLLQEVPNITYNWPYDYFSLVELAKIDASVVVAQREGGPLKSLIKPQGQTLPKLQVDEMYGPPTGPGPTFSTDIDPAVIQATNPDTQITNAPQMQADLVSRLDTRDIAFAGGLGRYGGAGNIAREGFGVGVDLGVGVGSQYDMRAGGGFFPGAAGPQQEIMNAFNQGFGFVNLMSNFNRNFFG
tara:strand:- start:3735 stop:7817 length:4083 start_codon:yes stop_codon:yes gene_type:complete